MPELENPAAIQNAVNRAELMIKISLRPKRSASLAKQRRKAPPDNLDFVLVELANNS